LSFEFKLFFSLIVRHLSHEHHNALLHWLPAFRKAAGKPCSRASWCWPMRVLPIRGCSRRCACAGRAYVRCRRSRAPTRAPSAQQTLTRVRECGRVCESSHWQGTTYDTRQPKITRKLPASRGGPYPCRLLSALRVILAGSRLVGLPEFALTYRRRRCCSCRRRL
jgi:hypothetical protein